MTAFVYIVAVLAVLSAVGIIVFKNPIHSALSLVANLFMVAIFFALLDAHFLAATQIIVYAGAIMVLVLFMLMLLNIKVESRSRSENVWACLAVAVGGLFLFFTVPLVRDFVETMPGVQSSATSLAQGPLVQGTVEAMGVSLFREYMFLFQASGVMLMVAIVGAVMLAKRSYR